MSEKLRLDHPRMRPPLAEHDRSCPAGASTVPLYLATRFCFARGSNRLHRWFQKTSLHRKHLEPFVRTKALTLRNKLAVMTSLTLFMGIGCFMMQGLLAAQLVLAAVWAFHIWYFTVCIKTLAANR